MFLDSLYHGTISDISPGNLCVVGDVHNRLGQFLEKVRAFLSENPEWRVIQLWDFCWAPGDFAYFLRSMIREEEIKRIQIVKWNHDDGVPTRHEMSLQDFWTSDDGDILTIRWAETPLFARIQWRSYYWEELSDEQFRDIIAIIQGRAKKPRIIITHDGPQSVVDTMWSGKIEKHSRTSLGLQRVLEIVNTLAPHEQGTTWIFWHHHEHQEEREGIHFKALGELETLII
jgi:hypothetical protein